MTTRWFYAKNGRKLGPVPFDELRRLVQSGALARTDMLLAEGSGKWVPVQTVLGQVQAIPAEHAKVADATQHDQGHRTVWRGTSVDLEIVLPANEDLIPKLPQTELEAPKAGPRQALMAVEAMPGSGRKPWATRRRLWLCLAGVGAAVLFAVLLFSGLRRGNRQEEEAPGAAGSTIINSIGMKLVLVPAGKFLMGSPETEEGRFDDEHQHEVEITQAFYFYCVRFITAYEIRS